MRFDKDFKEAISYLPSEEKDKLILRLLKKDLSLANRLYFELLDERTVEDRRAEMESKVKADVERMSKYYYSPGYLKMDMGYLSGDITEHVRITKDKYGEASLNLLMLNEVLKLNNKKIAEATVNKARKLSLYIIARAFRILILIQKLHEDYFIDFEDDLMALGQRLGENDHLMRSATSNGFDVNWLLQPSIPEDIAQIHKDLRARGYLRQA